MAGDYVTFTDEVVDNAARVIWRITCLKPLSDMDRAHAMANKALHKKGATTTLHGLVYQIMEVFVPVGPDGVNDPHSKNER